MGAHKIERIKWPMLFAPQLNEKAQQAYAALSSEDSQRFWSAKVKEGESPTEKVTRLTDMAVKWLKEHDTRESVIDMIVTEQFITMLPEGIRVWVKEHKPERSMIAGKLAEDYQQARKTAKDDQGRSKEKPPERGKRCLVCRKIGHLARECPNKVHKLNIRSSNSTDGYHNTTREESRQALLRCFTCDGKVTLQNNVPVRHYVFCGHSTTTGSCQWFSGG